MPKLSLSQFVDLEGAALHAADVFMLTQLVAHQHSAASDEGWPEVEHLTDDEHEAFASMLENCRKHEARRLSLKQRNWAQQVARRVDLDTVDPATRKPVPRGKEVPLAPVLQHLPKRPPSRR